MISVKQIEAFYWTARLGTVQKASVKLSVTQSAATKRIQELERLSATPLFAKVGTRLSLTAHGRHLFTEADKLLKEIDTLEQLRSEKSRLNRTLRIGITELTALTWFPAFAKCMKTAYPDLKLHPDVDLSATLREKVLDGALDVVVIQDIYVAEGLASIPVQTVEYGWFSKPGLVVQPTPVSIVELASHPVIEQTAGSGLTALSRHMFAEAGVEVEHIFGSNSLAALAGLVEAGMGVACLPVKYFRTAARKNRVQKIATSPKPPVAKYHLAFLPSDQMTLRVAIAAVAKRCASAH